MDYRTTRIYVRSLELIDLVAQVIRRLLPGFAFLADQARRSASSVTLNYMEGCGRLGVADRRRFFHIAIGSAMETSATLDVMHRFNILPAQELRRGQDLCDHLVAMLRRFR